MHTAKKKSHGFTLVELLIVIVVISILATISLVAYNGVQKRALNATRIDEARSWVQVFEVYKARKGVYPRQNDVTNTNTCLGTDFPNGSDGQPRCRNLAVSPGPSYLESSNATLMSDLALVAKVPSGNRTPAGGNGVFTVGPWVEFLPVPGSGVPRFTISTAIQSTNGNECSTAKLTSTAGTNGMYICSATINY